MFTICLAKSVEVNKNVLFFFLKKNRTYKVVLKMISAAANRFRPHYRDLAKTTQRSRMDEQFINYSGNDYLNRPSFTFEGKSKPVVETVSF